MAKMTAVHSTYYQLDYTLNNYSAVVSEFSILLYTHKPCTQFFNLVLQGWDKRLGVK